MGKHGKHFADLVVMGGAYVSLPSFVGGHLGANLYLGGLGANWNRDSRIAVRLFHQAAHRGSGNVVPLGDLGQGQSRSAVKDDLLAVNIEPRSADLASLKSRPSHTAFDTLHHE